MRLIRLRWRVSVLLGLLALGVPTRVFAQRIDLSPALVAHSIAREGFRGNSELNYADCVGDDVIEFPLVLTDRGSYQLQAWVGVECDATANRTVVGECWKLFSELPSSNTVSADLHVRDILAGYFTAADTSTPGALVSGTGIEACTDPQRLPYATPFTITFLLVDSNTGFAVAKASWSGTFKVTGPAPPEQLTLVKGDGQLEAHFSYSPPTADQTINGFQFYCDPPPDVAVDAGAAPDGGGLDCSNAPMTMAFVPGLLPPDGSQPCARAGTNNVSAKITGLVNGVPYRVAMAVSDNYANLGPLSRVACELPVRDDQEVRACSFSPRPVRSSFGWLGLLASGCWVSRRRLLRTSKSPERVLPRGGAGKPTGARFAVVYRGPGKR